MPETENNTTISYHNLGADGKRAYHALHQDLSSPTRPGIVFLAGHGSDMEGSKALAIEALADRHKIPFCDLTILVMAARTAIFWRAIYRAGWPIAPPCWTG